jgi:hypothetical protein
MANLALSHRIARAAVGALRERWASQRRQSKLDLSMKAVLIVQLGESANRALIRCWLP